MSTSAAGKVVRNPRDPKRLLARIKFEAAVFLLMLATFGAVQYQDMIVSRNISFSPGDTNRYTIYAFGDQNSGGTSTVTTDAARPLEWACTLTDTYQFPYCGYGLLFDEAASGRGLDLSKYETMDVVLSYHGPAEKLRINLKNHDPRYSDAKAGDSTKPNELEVPISSGTKQVLKLRLDSFGVAEWWIANKKIPAEESGPQFDNIVALEIQPGAGSKTGDHLFRIESISLRGQSLSQARWYLVILGFWVILAGFFLVHRVMRLKREFEATSTMQAEESEQLQVAWKAAESASRAKSEFLANMSHELRTPLNAILGYAQLLERGKLSEQHALAARTIHRSGTHLLTLITDILDLSKIEARKLALANKTLDLPACVHGVVDMMQVPAEEKGLAFSCSIAADVPRFLNGDEKRIRQVLINLVGNAIKFTQEGRVDLTIALISANAEHARIRFEVMDTGPGIADEQLDRIFQPFEQVGDSEQRTGGTGLGLAISRQIVSLMNGRIQVESQVGGGSRFWFDLDLAIADPLEHHDTRSPVILTGYRGERRKILIVDDMEENRAVLAHMLDRLGFTTSEAANGQEALAAAEADKPDLVFMDIRMPVMGGFEAIRRMRRNDSLAGIPVIALSASATSDVENSSLAAGANGFLAKPIEHEDLMPLLVRHLRLDWTSDAATRVTGQAEPAEPAMVAPPQAQMDQLMEVALAGNMRAIRQQAARIGDMDDRYRAFADKLQQLASTYQSPAILRLIETYSEKQRAA